MSGHRKCRRLDGGKNEIVTCSVCRSAASSCRGLSSTAGRPGGRRTEGRRPGGRHTAGHRLRTANTSLKVCTRVVKQMHMRVRVCMRACVHACMCTFLHVFRTCGPPGPAGGTDPPFTLICCSIASASFTLPILLEKRNVRRGTISFTTVFDKSFL